MVRAYCSSCGRVRLFILIPNTPATIDMMK